MPDAGKLPYPIARVYFESLREESHVTDQLTNTFATYSALLRFVGLTLVSQFLTSDHFHADSLPVISTAKAVARMRQPMLENLYSAINSVNSLMVKMKLDGRPFGEGGPFSAGLMEAVRAAGRAKAGTNTLHEAIRDLRNAQAHGEGAHAGHSGETLAEVRPLVLRALDLYAPALEQLTLLRSLEDNVNGFMELTGPGPDFASGSSKDRYLEELLRTSTLVLRSRESGGHEEYLQLFPLLIAGTDEDSGPVLSFDGLRIASVNAEGRKERTQYIKYIAFGGLRNRYPEYEHFRRLLDQKKISPYFDKQNFQAWSVADWAAGETRMNLDFHRGTKYFPDYYRERPGVEDRVRQWIAGGRKPALMMTAEAGLGKTSMFCRLADEMVEPVEEGDRAQDCVALVVGADLYQETRQDRGVSLFGKLCRVLGLAEYAKTGATDGFQSFHELLDHWRKHADHGDVHAGRRRLIILLDAANEAGDARAVLREVSELARAAHTSNETCGQVWVRLVVSIRTVYLSVLTFKAGLSDSTLMPSTALFEEFPGKDGTAKPWLEMPGFDGKQAQDLYGARARVGPACRTQWQELPAVTQALMAQPLIVDIFHTAFAGADSAMTLRATTEDRVWAAWFEKVMPDQLEHVVRRQFALRMAEQCLRDGTASLTRSQAEEVLGDWEGTLGLDGSRLLARADLNLLEQMEAAGVLRQNPAGGWEWRAQSLAEQIAFRVLEKMTGGWGAWLELPDSSLGQGALALMAGWWWRQERAGELAAVLRSSRGAAALTRGLAREVCLGAAHEIGPELERNRQRFAALTGGVGEEEGSFSGVAGGALAEMLVWDLPALLKDRLGAAPVLHLIAEAAVAVAVERRRLEPENTTFLRDLSVSYNKLGDLDRTVDAGRARQSYEKSLAIREKLKELEPENTTFLRDLSVSYDRLGGLYANTDAERAREYLEKDLGIAEQMVAIEPWNSLYIRDLVISHYTLGGIYGSSDAGRAQVSYGKALKLAEGLLVRQRESQDYQNLVRVLRGLAGVGEGGGR